MTGLSRPGLRPVRARRRHPDILHSSFSAVAATGSGSSVAPSLCTCFRNAGSRPSAPATPVLSAPHVAAGSVEDPALGGVGEVMLDAHARRLPATPAAALAAAAGMLARRRSDPAIGERMVQGSPQCKPIGLASFLCPADADAAQDRAWVVARFSACCCSRFQCGLRQWHGWLVATVLRLLRRQ